VTFALRAEGGGEEGGGADEVSDEIPDEIPIPRDFLLHTQGDIGSDSEEVVVEEEEQEQVHWSEAIFVSEDSQDSVATVRLGGRGRAEQGAGGGGLFVHTSITPS